MSDDRHTTGSASAEHAANARPAGFWTGRSGLIIPAILVVIGIFLIIGIYDMDIGNNHEVFGPRAFPWIVAVTCFVIAALMTVQILRTPEIPESMIDEDGNLLPGTASNWQATAITIGSFVLFTAILEPIGWIISAALVFLGITIGLGNKRYIFNLMVGLAISSIMQLVFSGLLGLNLPAGVMGWW